MKSRFIIKGILILILLISAYFVVENFYLNKQYPDKWNTKNWDLKQGWNPKIYRGERSYGENTTNTVKDNFTGLIWQKKENKKELSWSEAENYCKTLSLDKYTWRVPSIKELFYLVDIEKIDPCNKDYGCSAFSNAAVDREYFDIKAPKLFWTKTTVTNRFPSKDDPLKLRGLFLATGNLMTLSTKDMRNNLNKYHVLCVSEN